MIGFVTWLPFHTIIINKASGQVTKPIIVLVKIYYIKLKSRLSVCLSVRPSDRHDDNSVVPAWIDAGLARRDGYVFRYLIVHF